MKRIWLTGLTVIALAASIVASQRSSTPSVKPAAARPLHAFGAVHPRISSDGRQIAFSYHGSIWRMPRTGGVMTRLTDGEGFDIEPVWSPDGDRIAYLNSASMTTGELRVMRAEDGTPMPLSKRIVGTGKLCFHPDGRRVVGKFRVDGKGLGLASYDLKTGEVNFLIGIGGRTRFALSNDGKSIVYERTMDISGQQGGNNGPQANLWKLPLAGGEPVKIVRFASHVHDLCWSADDRSLYVVSELGGAYYDLWQVPLDDPVRSTRKLTFGQADEHRPSVSRDGRWLLYSDNRHSSTALVIRDLTTGLDETISATAMNFRKPTGILKLKTFDEKQRQPVVARVSIERENGKYFAPAGSLHRILKGYGHFYCDKQAELTLPAGKYRLRALRGPEYRPSYRSFEVEAGKAVELKIELERWTHQAARGWYSGENHIHANYGYGEWYNTPETMLRQCAGENLNVCNFMVANSDTDGVFDRQFFRGRPDSLSTDETILYWNQEFRSTIWGHMTLVNLSQVVEPVFTGFKDTTNPWDIPTNSDVADRAHVQNGLVNYTHVAQNPDDPYQNPYTGKSIPIDVALGKIDTLDLNASYRGTVGLWYRLLNCGFRLPASAGTDCFLNRIVSRLPGGDRVYVEVEEPFSYERWIAGLRAGRSFVTNGPMLRLSVNGKAIGETLKLADAGEVHIVARGSSQFPMDRVEVVFNGTVVATGKLTANKLEATIDHRLKVSHSGWLAVRATGPGHPDSPLGSQDAHTSPVYITVAGQPTVSRSDAEYFLKWIDRLSLAIRLRDRIPNDSLKRHVQSQLEAARDVYRNIAGKR